MVFSLGHLVTFGGKPENWAMFSDGLRFGLEGMKALITRFSNMKRFLNKCFPKKSYSTLVYNNSFLSKLYALEVLRYWEMYIS